jgi:hypothetical protein
MAYIKWLNSTQDTITVCADRLDPNYSFYDRTAHWGIGLDQASVEFVGSNTIPAFVVTGGEYQFVGLQSNTTYVVSCYITTNMGTVWLSDINASTTAPPTPVDPPPYYSWTYLKYSGGDFNLMAFEWNGLIDNINAVRRWNGYSDYLFTRAYSGDPFYGYMYNEAVAAVQSMGGGQGLSTVSSGSTVYASQLNNLLSAVNLLPR